MVDRGERRLCQRRWRDGTDKIEGERAQDEGGKMEERG